MAKCDCCGADVRPHELTQLLDNLRSPGVVDLCDSCAKWATDRKWALIKEANAQLKEEIRERAGKPPAPAPRAFSWLRNLFSTPIA